MTIVVAYSTDEAGLAALNAGMGQAAERNSDLLVVNATRGAALVDPRYSQGEGWEHIQARLEESGLTFRTVQPMGNDVAGLVLNEAEQAGAEMIVVGLRRRTPIGKLIMGSISQQILLDASCPVLAVKAPITT